jgi:hypothetical protein
MPNHFTDDLEDEYHIVLNRNIEEGDTFTHQGKNHTVMGFFTGNGFKHFIFTMTSDDEYPNLMVPIGWTVTDTIDPNNMMLSWPRQPNSKTVLDYVLNDWDIRLEDWKA